MEFKRRFIPFEDREILEIIYKETPHPMFNVEPHLFLWEIEQQFKHDSFTDYINRETHYELERLGYEWSENDKLFIGLTTHRYKDVKINILKRFAEIFIGSLSAGKYDFEPCSLGQKSLEKIAA